MQIEPASDCAVAASASAAAPGPASCWAHAESGSVHAVKPEYDRSIEASVTEYFERYQTTSAAGFRISADELCECGSRLIVHDCRGASR